MVDFMTLEEMRQQKERLHLTNEELSHLSGISVSTISKIMAGITKNPRYGTRLALEEVLLTKDREDLLTKDREDLLTKDREGLKEPEAPGRPMRPEEAVDFGGNLILRDSHGADSDRNAGLRMDIRFTFGGKQGSFTVDDSNCALLPNWI
ncbi:MAG: helix-turn-helix domain-containing protein [Firmicutes bacterium]|nr:helix-turn-helix domain-containing protein [Bacillota bacterium]